MYAVERVGEHELGSQESDTVARLRGDITRVLRHGEVDVQASGQRLDGRRDRRRRGSGRHRRAGGVRGSAFGDSALGAVDGHQLAVAQDRRRAAGPDDAGDAELAGDDRRVAGHAAAVGDDCGRTTDRRHPVRVGHGRDQHLAGEESLSFRRREQHTRRPARATRRSGQPGDQHGSRRTSLAPAVNGWGTERRDRSRLHEIGRAVGHRPFDVLRFPVVLLDGEAQLRNGEDLVVTQHPAVCLVRRQLDDFVVAEGTAHDLVRLVTDPARLQAKAVFVDHVGVGLDLAADHDFTESERPLDHDPATVAGRGIGGEHHAGAHRVDHLLHDHCDGRLFGHALGQPVGDHPLAVQRCPAVTNSLDDLVVTHDVREGRVHPCERRCPRVLCGR